MELIEQYRPQPRPDSPLHQLQLQRMEARREADESWKKLKNHLHEIVAPEAPHAHRSVVGTILSNAGAIVAGVQMGWRVLAAIRRNR